MSDECMIVCTVLMLYRTDSSGGYFAHGEDLYSNLKDWIFLDQRVTSGLSRTNLHRPVIVDGRRMFVRKLRKPFLHFVLYAERNSRADRQIITIRHASFMRWGVRTELRHRTELSRTVATCKPFFTSDLRETTNKFTIAVVVLGRYKSLCSGNNSSQHLCAANSSSIDHRTSARAVGSVTMFK
jgi:hypothetical protein